MKKLFLFVCLSGFILSAQSTIGTSVEETKKVNNCLRINLGFVSIWTGSMDVVAQNPVTGAWDVVVSSKGCGKEGGSFDWFWE